MRTVNRTLPHIPDSSVFREYCDDIMKSGVLTMGPYTEKFSRNFNEIVIKDPLREPPVVVNSCATALYISLMAIREKSKSTWRTYVIVPTNTFLATVNAVILSGYTPLICDVNSDHMCMDTLSMLRAVSKVGVESIAAVIPVHIAGYIAPDIDAICRYCSKNDIYVIEDAAHAIGSYRGTDQTSAGAFGDIGCYSTFATKIITTGEGGLITCKDPELANICRTLSSHGMVRNTHPTHASLDAGVSAIYPSLNFRMSEFSAALGVAQLLELNAILQRRKEIADMYYLGLDNYLELPPNDHLYGHWHYIVKLPRGTGVDRDTLCHELYETCGIQTANIYNPGCHEQELYKKYIKPTQSFTGYDDFIGRSFSIPIHTRMNNGDVTHVIESIVSRV